MVEALGTIARSGTKAFLDRIETAKAEEETALIGRFGVGFYSAFMVAERVEVISRRAGTDAAIVWSSDGKGSFAYLRRIRHTHRFAAPASCCIFSKTPSTIPSAPPSSGWCARNRVTCRCRSRSS